MMNITKNPSLLPIAGIRSPKTKKPKKEGNEKLKNWDYLPEGLKLFYEETPLKSIIFRSTRNGTKIQIKKPENKYNWEYSEWLFEYNKEVNRFGLFCDKESLWIYGSNDEQVMS